jgi:hypothetical protein
MAASVSANAQASWPSAARRVGAAPSSTAATPPQRGMTDTTSKK